MFEIIRADEMFELLDVVSSNMAIFRRTSTPRIDPHGDGWWLQGYNRRYFESIQKGTAAPTRLQAMYRPVLSKALHTASALAPRNLKDRIPERIKRKFWTENVEETGERSSRRPRRRTGSTSRKKSTGWVPLWVPHLRNGASQATLSDWLVDSRGETRTRDPGAMSSSPTLGEKPPQSEDAE